MPTTNYMYKVFIKISFMETNIYRTLYEYSKMHFYYINLSTPLSAATKCKSLRRFTDLRSDQVESPRSLVVGWMPYVLHKAYIDGKRITS